MKQVVPLVTCEHASNRVPTAFQYLFAEGQSDLKSHWGWDPGAKFWAEAISKVLSANLLCYDWTRLLVEINRSEDSPSLYSKYSSNLATSVKKYLLSQYYHPYRKEVKRLINDVLSSEEGSLIHLSIHSFTPVWEGKTREVEIGLLFDEAKEQERSFCELWRDQLLKLYPEYIVRLNEPYLGKDDGICTSMRAKFQGQDYLGIELEVNQKFTVKQEEIARVLTRSLKNTIDDYKNCRNTSIAG